MRLCVGARARAAVGIMPFFGKKENRQEGKKIPYKSGEKLAKEDRRLTSSASNVEEIYDMKEVLGT